MTGAQASYPIEEVQGLYRTIADLRKRVAAADLYRADAMERMEQQDQTCDALKTRIAELEATLRTAKEHAQAMARVVIDGMAEVGPDDLGRDHCGHINLMGAIGDPDYRRGPLSCRHIDTRATKPRRAKA